MTNIPRPFTLITFLVLLLTVALACSSSSRNNPSNPPVQAATQASIDPAYSTELATLPTAESESATSAPPPTEGATATSSATATATPSPTPTLHPMSIQALRQTSYPGSEITIEETLERGANYSRYYASYLSEGLKIYGLLTIPEGEAPPTGWPAIVFNHGYIPPAVYRTTERYIAYVDSLARSGYIVFRIDYRGHDNSEGEARGAYGDPGYLTDVLNAAAALRSFPQADPERVGMWGHSLGGYLTLRAMVIDPKIKAGVIWAGVVGSYPDLLHNWRRSGSAPPPATLPSGARRWRNDWLNRFGTPEENPDFWNSVSSNSFLADISGPVQLHHGTADTEVPIGFSENLYNQLQQAGKTAEYYAYEGDDHNLSTYFSQAMGRTIDFYNQYLKGEG